MSAGILNLPCDQGVDWRYDIVLEDKNGDTCNLSGYTAVSAYCGQTYNDADAVTMSAVFIDADNQESLNGDQSGKIRIEMSYTQTSSLDWTSGRYDVYVTEPSGDRVRVLQGQLTVNPKVPAGAA